MKLLSEELKVKGEVTVDQEAREMALVLMREIAYDNGFFHRGCPEQYKASFVNKIGKVAQQFYGANPDLLNDEDVELLCTGEHGEKEDRYNGLEFYKELDLALNDYFDNH